MTEAPGGKRDRTKELLNGGVAVTLTLSLLLNLARAVFEERTWWISEGPGLILVAVPGALLLVFLIARLGLPVVRRLKGGRDLPS